MKTVVTRSDFVHAFDECNRSENFSPAARRALFDYLGQIEEDTGEELELDPVGICCDFSEYDSALEAAKDYGYAPDNEEDETAEERENRQETEARSWLEDRTIVIDTTASVVIEQF